MRRKAWQPTYGRISVSRTIARLEAHPFSQLRSNCIDANLMSVVQCLYSRPVINSDC